MTRPKALVAWSRGKDSAWALHEVQRVGEVEVVGPRTERRTRMPTNRRLRLGLVVILATACAHQERQVVRLQPGEAVNLDHFDMHKQSLVIELREGEVVPLDVLVEGDYFATAPGTSVPVTVKRTCFMRVDDRGLRISPDGRDFDTKPRVPGSFQLGVGMTTEGKRATLRLTTPTK